MPSTPWPDVPVTHANFQRPPREYGILPFWFLNGKLDPAEMRYQLQEFRDKGMPGIILHGRFGLEPEYLGETFLDRIQLSVEEAERLGLTTWIYDEMNWPSGTADKRVLKARPDLAQRYLECLNFTVRGPWFTYLTGGDSRYIDFEKSTPVAAFAVRLDGDQAGQVIDLTANLSFRDVIPWEAPAGHWRLMYIVEKTADYYIDAIDPEATAEFLKLGYEPYAQVVKDKMPAPMLGFYTDEPAMFYYVSGGDHPIVPWSKDLFRRFHARNGYSLRPRLPDLFFDIGPGSARVRYDFYTTLTEFYSQAYYQQIHEWCQAHGVLFTGHLLYEEWLRRMIRVEGNVFKHLAHLDVTGVDHLYPIIGSRDRPDEHVAMKVGSSAAHQNGSPRLLCESFGGIFMDTTMQRMKWIADWEYVLGVNLLNPHGFHYTLEGPRKRDWPPSMFYQYPWWPYYGAFSDYIARLSHMLSGGRHVAKVAVLWPINAMFATYTPQSHNALGDRTEQDTNVLTDSLLRLHYDFDYIDEDVLAEAVPEGAALRVRDEAYELIVLPPMAHLKLATLEKLERFVAAGGRVLGMVFLPAQAFAAEPDPEAGLVDIGARMQALFGVDPHATLENYSQALETTLETKSHPGGGQTTFLRSYALARRLPLRLQQALGKPGWPESPHFGVDGDNDGLASRYFYTPEAGEREEITAEVVAERQAMLQSLEQALRGLITPDVIIDNPEVFYLHRVKDGRDLYFLTNPTFSAQRAAVTLTGEAQPLAWDPSTGRERPLAPVTAQNGQTRFTVELPPAGSLFVVSAPAEQGRLVAADVALDSLDGDTLTGYGTPPAPQVHLQRNGHVEVYRGRAGPAPAPLTLDGDWAFEPASDNALIIDEFWVTQEQPGRDRAAYTAPDAGTDGWLPIRHGAWSYQLPGEPSDPYPLTVWYRARFEAAVRPARLVVIVDGWAGVDWQLYVNGQPATAPAERSALDSEMLAVDITDLAQAGENALAIRLTLTSATDGLLDLLKLMGTFSVERAADGRQRLAEPRTSLAPCSWTGQGYPYYSGLASFRKSFDLPAGWQPGAAHRVFLVPQLYDDVVEIIVNGQSAGVQLWPPYGLEITEHLRPGANDVELRVANTLVNLLEAVERPSGLAGPVEVVAYNQYVFEMEK